VSRTGASGILASRIATSFEKIVEKPKAFLDSTLNLYTVFGVSYTVVV